MDRTMRCATVTASSTTDPQQIKVMELEHYDEQKDKKNYVHAVTMRRPS